MMTVMISDALRSPSPRTPQASELNAMLDEPARLQDTARDAESHRRVASSERQEACAARAALEAAVHA
jgi:hypothetical protein